MHKSREFALGAQSGLVLKCCPSVVGSRLQAGRLFGDASIYIELW